MRQWHAVVPPVTVEGNPLKFEGRSGLLEAIDETTVVSARGQSTEARPVLVLEGCGGSGRTAVLNRALDRWKGTTPAVLVRPRELVEDADGAVRPVLAAVMLGLSPGAPGYALKFERVLLAHIAIKANLRSIRMRRRPSCGRRPICISSANCWRALSATWSTQ